MTENLFSFERIIEDADRIVPNGCFIVSDSSGNAVWFDRREESCESDLRAFLRKLADACVIMKSDIGHWALWLLDEGRDTVATTRRNQNPDAPVDWQGYDFAGH